MFPQSTVKKPHLTHHGRTEYEKAGSVSSYTFDLMLLSCVVRDTVGTTQIKGSAEPCWSNLSDREQHEISRVIVCF